MVRLMLTLTPVVCILAAIAFSVTLDNYLVDDRPSENKDSASGDADEENSDEENDKKKRKDLYNKVHVQIYFTYSHVMQKITAENPHLQYHSKVVL